MKKRASEFPVSSLSVIFFIVGTLCWVMAMALQFVSSRVNILYSIFWMLVGLGLMFISTQIFYVLRVLRKLRRKGRIRRIRRQKKRTEEA